MRLLRIVLLLSVLAAPAHPAIIYVPGDQPTVGAALAVASAGDEVAVACGTYVEFDLVLPAGVTLRSITGQPDCVLIDAASMGSSVLRADDANSATRVEGITFRGGTAFGVVVSGPATVTRCEFRETSDGFAAEVIGSNPVFEDCVFAQSQLGGLKVSGSTGEFLRCAFRDNLGIAGAHILQGTPRFTDCEFSNNVSPGGGGGVRFATSTGSPTFVRCLFDGNQAEDGGGALIRFAGASFQGCTFSDNSAAGGQGAGLSLRYGAHVTVVDCMFRDNTASATGGGIHVAQDSHLDAITCVFTANQATVGAGVAVLGASAAIQSSTFHGNAPTSSGAHLSVYDAFGVPPVAQLERSILSHAVFGGAVKVGTGATATLSCCDLAANVGGDWTGSIADQADINGNFSADPLFCNPDDGDFTIRADSPCAPPGITGCGLVGALAVGCGSIATEELRWGEIKALYR